MSDSDPFDEIIAAETDRDPDLAVIEAGSRTLRTQGGPPEADVPARPADPEVDKALRAVEADLATRWGETKLEPSVSRISALTDVLGDPQRSYPSIHITGTNGKTSTARMIEALLGAFELSTGRYTSPHVPPITERIRLATGIVNPYTRGPALLAQQAAALQDASGGRLRLGIGPSASGVGACGDEGPVA